MPASRTLNGHYLTCLGLDVFAFPIRLSEFCYAVVQEASGAIKARFVISVTAFASGSI
jgi:hypothetical protein